MTPARIELATCGLGSRVCHSKPRISLGNRGLENLHEDLKRLGLRKRRFHDFRRSFVSHALAGGARSDVLKWVSHGGKRSIIDLYTSIPWAARCEAVLSLKLKVREGQLLQLQKAASFVSVVGQAEPVISQGPKMTDENRNEEDGQRGTRTRHVPFRTNTENIKGLVLSADFVGKVTAKSGASRPIVPSVPSHLTTEERLQALVVAWRIKPNPAELSKALRRLADDVEGLQ